MANNNTGQNQTGISSVLATKILKDDVPQVEDEQIDTNQNKIKFHLHPAPMTKKQFWIRFVIALVLVIIALGVYWYQRRSCEAICNKPSIKEYKIRTSDGQLWTYEAPAPPEPNGHGITCCCLSSALLSAAGAVVVALVLVL
jgi:hypothetical protein